MNVRIFRYGRCPWGTYGHLTVAESTFECHTVEKPWANNKPFHSCLVAGLYRAIRRPWFQKKGAEFVLVSDALGVYEKLSEMPNDEGRFACLIHVANKPSDVAGCIGLGTPQAFIGGQWAVGASTDTVAEFNALMPDEFDLEII